MKTQIGGMPPQDGREWYCQCARCGSSLDRVRCENCGGDGVTGHNCGDDTCCCLDPEDNVTCGSCRGECGFWQCLSSTDWCQQHPLRGRELVERSTPEWYLIETGEQKGGPA